MLLRAPSSLLRLLCACSTGRLRAHEVVCLRRGWSSAGRNFCEPSRAHRIARVAERRFRVALVRRLHCTVLAESTVSLRKQRMGLAAGPQVFAMLGSGIHAQLLEERDPHGNVQVIPLRRNLPPPSSRRLATVAASRTLSNFHAPPRAATLADVCHRN